MEMRVPSLLRLRRKFLLSSSEILNSFLRPAGKDSGEGKEGTKYIPTKDQRRIDL